MQTGAGEKVSYATAFAGSPPPEHNSQWGSSREKSPGASCSNDDSSQPCSTASFRTVSSPGSPAGGSVSSAATVSLSPSSFAGAARAFAAAVATPLANHTRRCLLDSLSSIVGKKLLLLDETLAGALSLLVDAPTLQQQGVDRCFPLRSYPLHASAVSAATGAASLVLFFCRPHLSLLPLIAQHIYFIERTYNPTRPQGGAAAAASPAAEERAAGRVNDPGGSNRTPSVSPSTTVVETREEVRKSATRPQEEHSDEPQELVTLACRFPVPTSFSPSGRHYFVVCIPAASDCFISEFRRWLASGPVLPPSATTGGAAGHGGATFGSAAAGSSTAASDPQGQESSSAASSGSVASSLLSNLSSLPANLFGGTASQAASAKSHGLGGGAAGLTPLLSQGSATVTSCPLFFFPLAQDLLSLELPNSYRDLHLYGDRTPSQMAAAAVELLQDELLQGGLIPQLRSLGSAAKAVADQLIQRRKERQAQQAERQQQQEQNLSLYESSAAGVFGRAVAFSGAGGGYGLSYSAAAAAARAYRVQIGHGNQRLGDLSVAVAKEEQTTAAGVTKDKRGDSTAPTEELVFQDSQDSVELSVPLVPLAPPARFVLSRDDLAPEERDESCTLQKGESGAAVCRDLTADRLRESASAVRTSDLADEEAINGRLSSEDTCQGEYRSPREGHGCESREKKDRVTRNHQTRALKVDMLVLIDRRSDLITPLCTAFTYEALLDAVFGIDAAAVDIPQQLLLQQPQQQHTTAQQHVVTQAEASSGSGRSGSLLSFTPFFGGEKETETRSSKAVGVPVLLPVGARRRISLAADGLFALLRDLHQSAVGARLHSIASGIQQTYKEKDALRSIQDISVFINKFRVKQKEHSSLSLHVRLASFLAAVTQDPAFVQRLALEDELLQSGVSSSSSGSAPPLKSSILGQFEALLEDAAAANRLWWAPGAVGVDTKKPSGGEVYTQQRLQQPQGPSSAAGTTGTGGGGGDGNNRWRGTAAAGTGLVDFYRLLCLASLVNGGLRSKQIENIRLGLLQHFGFEEVERLALLHRVGLLRQNGGAGAAAGRAAGTDKGGSSEARSHGGVDGAAQGDAEGMTSGAGLAPGSWKILKRDCILLTDGSEGDQAMMDSIAYACSGYAPLSVRLIEILFEQASGWRAIPHLLSLLWGPAMEVRQQQQPMAFITEQRETGTADALAARGMLSQEQAAHEQEAGGEPAVAPEDVTTVVVFFLGGITYAEVAAIRRLNELELQRYHQRRLQSFRAASAQSEDSTLNLRRFVIMTTEVINAKKLIESCIEPTPAGTPVRFPWSPCICSEDNC